MAVRVHLVLGGLTLAQLVTSAKTELCPPGPCVEALVPKVTGPSGEGSRVNEVIRSGKRKRHQEDTEG